MGVVFMGCCGTAGPDGESLVLVGAAAAIQLAQGRSTAEVDLLAAFFTILGDNLALIAVQRANEEARQALCQEQCKKQAEADK